MAKYRSPILGYNHNISHRGLVFHVQTEDSGVDHPHLFTHLFYGGVIINTRKLDYDAEAAESTVKSLMQAQHKSILKLLKRGEFDEKIDRYFGDDPNLLPAKGAAKPAEPKPAEAEAAPAAEAEAAPAAEAAAEAPPEPAAEPSPHDVSAAFEAIKEEQIKAPPEPAPEPAPAPVVATPPPATRSPAAAAAGKGTSDGVPRRTPTGEYSRRNLAPERVTATRGVVPDPTMAPRQPVRPPPRVIHDRPTMPVQRGRPTAARPIAARPLGKKVRVSDRVGESRGAGGSSVVVSRPAVIIGAPAKVVGAAPATSSARARPRRFAREESGGKGIFGKDMVSEKSLDEVILAYLSDDSSDD